MKKNKILFITGARPNLVKLAPIYNYFKKKNYFILDFLHTNQHSNKSLFLNQLIDLKLPFPRNFIKKKKFQSDLEMISYLMREIYFFLKKIKPKCIIIFGDVDSTLAAALAASKLYIPISHIESGLRSKNMDSKEEINRRIIDKVSTFNFAPTPVSLKNLFDEGMKKNSFYVGNIIIENFFNLKNKIYSSKILNKLKLKKKEYILVTLHRYQNIDNSVQLKKILKKLKDNLENFKIIFCVHPRTKNKIKAIDKKIFEKENLKFVDALAYTEFSRLLLNSKFIITDSGGVLEEAYFHKKTCYVIRNDIERNDLINNTNTFKINDINKDIFKVVNKQYKNSKLTRLWDSQVSKRIFDVLKDGLKN